MPRASTTFDARLPPRKKKRSKLSPSLPPQKKARSLSSYLPTITKGREQGTRIWGHSSAGGPMRQKFCSPRSPQPGGIIIRVAGRSSPPKKWGQNVFGIPLKNFCSSFIPSVLGHLRGSEPTRLALSLALYAHNPVVSREEYDPRGEREPPLLLPV